LDALLESDLAVRVATLPSPHDPDSLIKAEGPEAFRTLIEKAPGFFDWLLDRLCRQHGTDSDRGRSAVVRAMGEAVRKTGNAVLADTHAQKTAVRLGLSPDAVRQEFKRIQTPRELQPQPVESEQEETPQMARPSAIEQWLLKLLLANPELVPWAVSHLPPEWIPHSQVRRVVESIYRRVQTDEWRGVASLVEDFEDAPTQALITEAAAGDRKIPNPGLQLPDVAMKLRNASMDAELAGLSRELGQADLPEALRLDRLRRQEEIRRWRRQPLPPVAG
jgi:DNA primase